MSDHAGLRDELTVVLRPYTLDRAEAADAVLAVVGPLLDQAEADRDAAVADFARFRHAYDRDRDLATARAERAEAQVRAVEALCEPNGRLLDLPGWVQERIRAVLASTPTQPKEQT